MPSAQIIPSDGFVHELDVNIRGGDAKARTECARPLVYSGSLDRFPSKELTPVIGREYEGLQVTELLETDNDQLIVDLAATSACFFTSSKLDRACVLTLPQSRSAESFSSVINT